MQFEDFFNLVIKEQDNAKEEEPTPQPWSLEITKDPSKGAAYNELGDLIIKLFEIRAKL